MMAARISLVSEGMLCCMAAVCAVSIGSAGTCEVPKMLPQMKRMTANITPQMMSCRKPTSATPMILPIMSWKGFTLDTMSSMMRLVFSSITLCITAAP